MSDNTAMPIIVKAKPLTAAELKEHVNLISEVLLSVMQSGVHYDTIPGTNSPTLLKPGAEKILTTFRIACLPEIVDVSTDDEIRYRVIARGVHQSTGIVVGAGVGECSSNEEKYKWRGVVCKEEWDATDETRRRTKWNKGWGDKPAQPVDQVRTNPSDLANTILKMAKKRAMVDLCLTATAASDVFTQDMEDMPPELIKHHEERQKQAQSAPRTASGNNNKQATEPQCKMLRAKLHAAGKEEAWLCEQLKVSQLEELNMKQVTDAVNIIIGK